jgi:hypothetical protein
MCFSLFLFALGGFDETIKQFGFEQNLDKLCFYKKLV